jgi:hypothetical protein
MLKALGLSLLCVLASASLTVLGAVFLNSAWHTVPSTPAALFTVLGITLVVLSVLAWIWTIQILCNSRWCMKDYLGKEWLKDFETGAAMGMDAQHTPPEEPVHDCSVLCELCNRRMSPEDIRGMTVKREDGTEYLARNWCLSCIEKMGNHDGCDY